MKKLDARDPDVASRGLVADNLERLNPDWAVLIEDERGERLYVVVETKGSLLPEDLRDTERGKIACGRARVLGPTQ